jgi:hypothetical protein
MLNKIHEIINHKFIRHDKFEYFEYYILFLIFLFIDYIFIIYCLQQKYSNKNSLKILYYFFNNFKVNLQIIFLF